MSSLSARAYRPRTVIGARGIETFLFLEDVKTNKIFFIIKAREADFLTGVAIAYNLAFSYVETPT